MNNSCHAGGTRMHLGQFSRNQARVANDNVHLFDDGRVLGRTLRVLIRTLRVLIRMLSGWGCLLPWEEGEERKTSCFDEVASLWDGGSAIPSFPAER
jgi:hypothetical protein